MKRVLTYHTLMLLTLLASLLFVASCQDDTPTGTTEVMMTFTTRALVTHGDTLSTALGQEKMKDLRVIMLRENGTVVDNHLEPDIKATSVTFTFTTPIQSGGEYFTFLAVANEESIQSTSTIDWLNCNPGDDLSSSLSVIKAQQIGNGSAFALSDGQAIPQTKQWTVEVPQKDTYVENQQLDFVASKISVKFKNHTANEQRLSDIMITGIKPNGKGYLFEQASNDYVAEDVNLAQIDFSDVTVASGDSVIQSYYTYPVDGENFSNPTLYATWNENNKDMPLKIGENYISSLLRGQHLQIVVTLTGQGMIYHVADWEESPTHIGSPTPEGGYDTEDWIADNDIVIGGDDEPGGGEGGGTVVPGDVIWSKELDITISGWSSTTLELTDDDLTNFKVGNVFGLILNYANAGNGNGFRIIDGNWKDLPSIKEKYYSASTDYHPTENTILECILTEEDITAFKSKQINLWGNSYTVPYVYIKAPTSP